MTSRLSSDPLIPDCTSIQARREFLQLVRTETAERHAAGQRGIEISNWLSDQIDNLLSQMLTLQLQQIDGIGNDLHWMGAIAAPSLRVARLTVAGAGDLDGEGLTDLAVGAYLADSGAGAVFLFSGGLP